MQKACAYDVRKAVIRDLLISIYKTGGFKWQTAHTKGCLEDRCVIHILHAFFLAINFVLFIIFILN